jgi:hypothetical protein
MSHKSGSSVYKLSINRMLGFSFDSNDDGFVHFVADNNTDTLSS